ncbi:MAG: 2-oxoglutarate ferredoxin oxidoreductase subunit beta [Oligoflexia bacterium]|nr:MAG: 2-oxoglutarate ferredoxin oxidoreductase subunit beta [Oligoflexia bacterium]
MTTQEVNQVPRNKINLEKKDYVGGVSTLCTGCGHDQITNHIVTAFYNLSINPHDVAKMSGIGCSSKTPGYFLSKAHGFNSMHGRMAPVSTGSKVANQHLIHIGVSGDGDSASIGFGGFAHLMRRNLPMTYIVANNGVYGLTKGQFSATADKGAKLKSGEQNPFENIDLCTMALDLGCTFIARSFSGDAKQLVPLLQAALKHKGTALIDVISPCVTFNNHDGSTKSFSYVKEHDISLQELGFIPATEAITVDYAEGTMEVVQLPDGSQLTLKKLNSREHNVHSRLDAAKLLYESKEKGELLTGLLYIDETRSNFSDTLNLCDKPLAHLTEKELRPSREAFSKVMKAFK